MRQDSQQVAAMLRRIRALEIKARHLVDEIFAGSYHSVFKGQGMNFEEVREYMPGDEVRSIDWNVTARLGEPHVKRFTEERELCVMLVLDASASNDYGSGEGSKREMAAEVAATLAFSAARNNDRVALQIFSDEVELYLPPAKGRSHVLRIIREAVYWEPRKRGTDLAVALEYLNRVLHRRTVVFLLSDFQSPDFSEPLRLLSRKHDVVAVEIADPREERLPNVGRVVFEDAETGEQIEFNSSSRAGREKFAGLARRRRKALVELFARRGIDHVALTAGTDYLPAMKAFFEQRERRQRR